MKRTTIMKQVCMALLAVIFISSCKKEADVTITRALIDDWSLNKFSLDDGNGVLDIDEVNKAFDLGKIDLGTVTFGELNKGRSNPVPYYFPATFGNGEFTWSTDDRNQEITITDTAGNTTTTKIIFQDLDHFAILEQHSFFFGQGLAVWNFYSRR